MRVVITRPREQAESFAQALRARGFEPVHFPTIRIAALENPAPIDAALERLHLCDWAIFTSTNAVEAVWARLAHTGLPFPDGVRVAAIGPKTARRLQAHGIRPDFVPHRFLSEAILPGLGDLAGKRVFLPLGDLAADALPAAIETAGGIPLTITAYRTLPAQPDPAGLAALRSGVDAVTFTSGSTARNFVTLLRRAGLDPFHLPGNPAIACIGPKTAAAARAAGLRVHAVAKEHTVEGLLAALEQTKPHHT